MTIREARKILKGGNDPVLVSTWLQAQEVIKAANNRKRCKGTKRSCRPVDTGQQEDDLREQILKEYQQSLIEESMAKETVTLSKKSGKVKFTLSAFDAYMLGNNLKVRIVENPVDVTQENLFILFTLLADFYRKNEPQFSSSQPITVSMSRAEAFAFYMVFSRLKNVLLRHWAMEVYKLLSASQIPTV